MVALKAFYSNTEDKVNDFQNHFKYRRILIENDQKIIIQESKLY